MPESSSSSGAPPPLRCPRCNSANTKFCYYNNYSLSQPRHFCKSCRCYWTKGGSLRNIPIGGGCRKPTKKPPSFALRLFHGITPSSSSMAPDHFQGLSLNPFPFTTTTTTSGPCNQPMPGLSSFNQLMEGGHGDSVVAPPSQNVDMASSIESLSAQNLELHWKLQQQRMSLLYGGGGDGEPDSIINDKPTTPTTNRCSQYLMDQHRDQHQNPTNNNSQEELLGHEADGSGTTPFVGVGPDVAALEKPQPMYFHNLEAAEGGITDDIINPNSMPNAVVHPSSCDNNNGAGNEAAAEWFLDTGDSYGGKEEEESNVNARNINATKCLNDDGTSGAQGWTDADESHHFNGLV